LLPKGVMNIS